MAGFFGFFDFTKEGKGVEKGEMPKKRFFIFFDIYFRKFWKIITVNLLFILTLLPIFILWLILFYFSPQIGKISPTILFPIIIISSSITVGPSICGLVKVLRNYAREEHSFTASDYWEAFRKNFLMSVVVWYVNLILAFIFYYALSFYYANINASMINIVPLAFAGTAALILLFMQYNIYVLLVTFKVNLFQLFKNSIIFAIVALKSNFITSLILGFFSIIMLFASVMPPVVILLIFFMPATYAFIATFNIYPHIKKYLIDPILNEEKEKNNEAQNQEEDKNETIFNDTVILEERNKK